MQLFSSTDWWRSELRLMFKLPCTTRPYAMQSTQARTHTHIHTHTRFVKSNENVSSSNLLELGIRGWYIKILPQMQTLAKPTRFINHLRRKHVCVCVCVWVCVACVSVNPPLLSSFRKWPLFTCHTLLPPPNTHTHSHCSAVQHQVMAVHSTYEYVASPKPEG